VNCSPLKVPTRHGKPPEPVPGTTSGSVEAGGDARNETSLVRRGRECRDDVPCRTGSTGVGRFREVPHKVLSRGVVGGLLNGEVDCVSRATRVKIVARAVIVGAGRDTVLQRCDASAERTGAQTDGLVELVPPMQMQRRAPPGRQRRHTSNHARNSLGLRRCRSSCIRIDMAVTTNLGQVRHGDDRRWTVDPLRAR